MRRLTLLLLGVVSVIGIGLVSPVMSDFALDFPEISQTDISMVVTMPAITLLLGLLSCSILSGRWQRKRILLISLVLVTAGGIAPAFLNNFYLILICRGILGFGMGFGMPLQASYFAEYPEQERAALFGWSSAMGGIISAVLLFLIALVRLPWRGAFLLYGFFALLFVMCIVFIPKEEKAVKQNIEHELERNAQAPALINKKELFALLLGYITAFFVMAQYFIVPTTISFYLTQNGLGGAEEASVISSAGTLVMAGFGILYPYLYNRLRHRLPALVLLLGAAAFVLYAVPMNQMVLALGYCLIAVLATLFPMTVTMKITEILPQNKVAVGSASFTAIVFLGQFISPYYQKFIMEIMSCDTRGCYVVFAIIMLLLAILNAVSTKRSR